ncbi:MAG: hypothetical protein ACO1O1_03340 [Adhaeribacter sp.]
MLPAPPLKTVSSKQLAVSICHSGGNYLADKEKEIARIAGFTCTEVSDSNGRSGEAQADASSCPTFFLKKHFFWSPFEGGPDYLHLKILWDMMKRTLAPGGCGFAQATIISSENYFSRPLTPVQTKKLIAHFQRLKTFIIEKSIFLISN